MIQKLSVPALNRSSDLDNPGAGSLVEHDATGTKFRARWIDSAAQLKQEIDPWIRLSRSAVHANFCFEPNFLLPALEHLNQDQARVLIVEAAPQNDPEATPIWCGLLPLVPTRVYGLPFSAMEIWKHDQCFDCTPLLRRGCAEATLKFAFEFLRQEGVSMLSADTVAATPCFDPLWKNAVKAAATHEFVRQSFDRACFRPMADAETYIQTHVSKSIRKNTRRLSRRLEEQGKLERCVYQEDCDYALLAKDFLKLEASGWKREAGTALLCDVGNQRFFEAMVEQSAAMNRIKFLCIKLNDQPIAMLCDLYSEHHGFSFKTCFDEAYSSYSPGLLAEVYNIEAMHGFGVDYVDSCTEPDNTTMNRVWGDRISFRKSIIGLRPGLSTWALKSLPMMRRWTQSLKKLLKKSED